jgi:predicted PurR-regulated permease PerM
MLKLELSYRGILLIIGTLVGLWMLTKLWPILLLLASSLIFTVALLPYVEWLVTKGLPRTVAVLVTLLAILAAIAGMFALVAPAMIDEFGELERRLPEDAREAEEFLHDLGIDVELQERAAEFEWGDVISGRAAFNYGQRALLISFTIFTAIVLTAYLLVDLPRLSRFVYQFVPPGSEGEFETLMRSMARVVGGYIRGQVVTSTAIGLFTLLVLLVLDVPHPVAFAILAAFMDIIPLVGAVIAIILPTLAAFQESPEQAVAVFIALVLYQQFEDRFLVPKVYTQTLNLPPIVVLITVLVGARLLGIVGVLLALPAAAVARVILEYVQETHNILAIRSTSEETLPGKGGGSRPQGA